MNGIDEELGCDPRLFLILAEAKKTQPRDYDNRGIRIPQFR
jgi:hypothetical protein